MSFLTIRPYIPLGDKLTKGIVTVDGTYKKGTTVTQKVEDSLKNTSIKLKVTDTPTVHREFNKTRVKTYNTDGKSSFVYYGNGDAGTSFTVKCLISKKDKLKNGKTVFYYLNHLYTKHFSVSVVIDTELVPNGVYMISNFTEYNALRKDYYEIEIEFSKHTKPDIKLTNKVTVLQSHLKKCKKPSSKVYTTKQIKNKKAKSSTCIKYVNKMLYKKGYLSKKTYKSYGSYWTKYSRKALVKFQKKWNKKGLRPKLNEKGKISKNCWKAIKRYPEVK